MAATGLLSLGRDELGLLLKHVDAPFMLKLACTATRAAAPTATRTPRSAVVARVPLLQWARAHWSTARWPPSAARALVYGPQGQPLARAHWSTASSPLCAAKAHVSWFHWQPLARAHWSTARWPRAAARAHV